MAGGNLKRSTATDIQARGKKSKTKSPKDATEQSAPSERSETLLEAADPDVDEFEDDPSVWNPFASQLSKTLGELNKPDHWPRDFAKHVRQRQGDLLEEIRVKSQAMTANQQRFSSEFHGLIAAALSPIGLSMTPATHPLKITHVTPATQPLHAESTILIEESKKLLAQYQQLIQQQSETSRLADLIRRFATDKEQVKLAIAAGRRVAEADIDDMLADKTREVRGRKRITADDETLGSEVLLIGRKQRVKQDVETDTDEECWGTVAYKTTRAVKKLHQATSMEE